MLRELFGENPYLRSYRVAARKQRIPDVRTNASFQFHKWRDQYTPVIRIAAVIRPYSPVFRDAQDEKNWIDAVEEGHTRFSDFLEPYTEPWTGSLFRPRNIVGSLRLASSDRASRWFLSAEREDQIEQGVRRSAECLHWFRCAIAGYAPSLRAGKRSLVSFFDQVRAGGNPLFLPSAEQNRYSLLQ